MLFVYVLQCGQCCALKDCHPVPSASHSVHVCSHLLNFNVQRPGRGFFFLDTFEGCEDWNMKSSLEVQVMRNWQVLWGSALWMVAYCSELVLPVQGSLHQPKRHSILYLDPISLCSHLFHWDIDGMLLEMEIWVACWPLHSSSERGHWSSSGGS